MQTLTCELVKKGSSIKPPLMKTVYFLLFLSLLGSTVFCCKPDEEGTAPPISCIIASKKYIYPDKTFNETKYTYTSSRLQKIEEHNSTGKLLLEQEYEFSNGRAVKLITSNSTGKLAETLFTYDGDKLKKMEHLEKKADQSFGKLYEKTFEYTGDKISRVNYTFFNGGSAFYALYEYTGDNITTVKAYETTSEQLLEENYYHYDDKANPFYQMHLLRAGQVQEASKNNVIHSKIVAHRHVPQLPEVSYTYEYNSTGNPSKKVVNAPGWGSIAEEIYSYTCH